MSKRALGCPAGWACSGQRASPCRGRPALCVCMQHGTATHIPRQAPPASAACHHHMSQPPLRRCNHLTPPCIGDRAAPSSCCADDYHRRLLRGATEGRSIRLTPCTPSPAGLPSCRMFRRKLAPKYPEGGPTCRWATFRSPRPARQRARSGWTATSHRPHVPLCHRHSLPARSQEPAGGWSNSWHDGSNAASAERMPKVCNQTSRQQEGCG